MQYAPTHDQRANQAYQQWQLGQKYAKAGRWDAAVKAHAFASRLVPNDSVYALNHARALLSRGQVARAGEEAQRAFALDRTSVIACELAAECLVRENRCVEAVALMRSLDPALPRDPAHHGLLGLALMRSRQPREAMNAFMSALAGQPDWSGMHHNLGLCFGDLGMQAEAAQCFETALILCAGKLELGTRGLASYYARDACQWKDSAASLQGLTDAVRALPADASVGSTPFAHIGLTTDRNDQLRAARSCARYQAAGATPLPAVRSDWKAGERRLRIGYVSSDFHHHATAMLMAEMIERHDRERFEVRLYSHGVPDGSPMRARLEAACEAFVDVQAMTDGGIAQRARDDRIDILIDLKGHTRDNRLGIFAYRAAPVQVSFLGFPGTTGADYIDYLIGDRIVTPLEHAAAYSEKLALLPQCYQPNDRLRPLLEPPTRASQGLPEGALVLCSFNQPFKISPELFDGWCRIMKAVPHAVLWQLEWNTQALPNLKREAASRGIDPKRLIGAPRVHSSDHVARFRLADIFVDTFPCNAHTTASDSLWAGVPVVTQIGETFASRVAASLLTAVGTPELICPDQAAYEQTVIDLARDPARRAALRDRLVAARQDSPLFDTVRFTHDIEALYLRMAQRHADGLPPDHLAAEPAP